MCVYSRELPKELEQKLDVVKSLKSVPVKEVNFLNMYYLFLFLIALCCLIQEYFELNNFFTFILLAFIPAVFLYDVWLSRKRKELSDKVEGVLSTVGCTMLSDDFILFKDTGDVIRFDTLCEIVSNRKPY